MTTTRSPKAVEAWPDGQAQPGNVRAAIEPECESSLKTRPVRIMQITWSLVAGGSEIYAYKVASALDERKYEAFMCALDQGGALEPEIAARGIPYFIMNRRPGIHLSLMWRLLQLFRKTRVDVIQTHHFNQLFYSAIGARLAGARIIHTEHSIEYLKRRKYRFALRWLSRLCDKVIAIGPEGAHCLLNKVAIPAHKIEIIRAGVEAAADGGSRPEARKLLGLQEQDRVAVIVARLFPEKNHILLLEAFRIVANALPSAKLLIVGEGTERARIEKAVSELGLQARVQILGVRRDIATILAASDLFVLSSDREGLPIAVLEAMAASKPVVATAVGDLRQLVSDGVTGRLVSPHNRRGLAEAMLCVLGDPVTSERMGSRAGELVSRSFSLGSMIEKHEALFRA